MKYVSSHKHCHAMIPEM